MRIRKNLTIYLLFIITVVFIFSAASTAAEKQRPGDETLLETYHAIEPKLAKNSFGLPVYLESLDRDGKVDVDVYGIFDHPFNKIMSVLRVPANWCDIVSMTPNIKACTYREMTDSWQLIFYTGRKTYQVPEDAYPFTFSYRNVEQRQGYLNIALSADEGPLGTKEHKMRFEAAHLSNGKTFVHVGYSHTYGTLLRLAGNVYFSTVGRDKIGFTVTGTDRNGNPVYVGGSRGAIERNAVRYYFAIQSLMDTLHHPDENRFNMRINEWYDFTDRYRKQLFEMEKKEYLAVKAEEHKNQVALQRRIKAGGP